MKIFHSFASFMANILPTLAPKDSPTFTGAPTAPSTAINDDSTKLATTGFVQGLLAYFRLNILEALFVKKEYLLPAGTNVGTVIQSGFYRLMTDNTDIPAISANHGLLLVIRGADTITQQLTEYSTGVVWVRAGNPPAVGGGQSWTPWRKLAYTDNTVFSGAPTVPTQAVGTNNTVIANTTFVQQNRALGIAFVDRRGLPTTPDYTHTRSLAAEFQDRYAVGNPPVNSGSAPYVGILNARAWDDYSGGVPIQIAVGTDTLAMRYATSTSAWSGWSKLARTHNEGFTGDTGIQNITVSGILTSLSGVMELGGAGQTPYLDFKYQGGVDFNTRIMQNSDGSFHINSSGSTTIFKNAQPRIQANDNGAQVWGTLNATGNISAAGALYAGGTSAQLNHEGNIAGPVWSYAGGDLWTYLSQTRTYDGFGTNTFLSGGGGNPYGNGGTYNLPGRPGAWVCQGGFTFTIGGATVWGALFTRIS